MTRIKIFALVLVSLAGCAIDSPSETTDDNTSTETSALSASEVTHTYFSDAAFSKEVGEVVLSPNCAPGKIQWGITNTHYYVVDSVACNTGAITVSCYEWRDYSGSVGGDFYQVECPSSVF